mmetsp:Transcript_4757/g.8148  ORF Transcript_4757/g.8148 Transcript_4757/m.8148 type:complete len:520 (-) Transcript_4757:132-1691(-)
MGARKGEFTTSGPNAHMVCLTDWLGNRNLRNFLLHFSEHLWADATRNLCLLGVLCLQHLAPGTSNLWSTDDLSHLVDFIQREERWPTEMLSTGQIACATSSPSVLPSSCMPRAAARQVHRKPSPVWRETFLDTGFQGVPNLRASSPGNLPAGSARAHSQERYCGTARSTAQSCDGCFGNSIDSARMNGIDASSSSCATTCGPPGRHGTAWDDGDRLRRAWMPPAARAPGTPVGCKAVSGPVQESMISPWRRSRSGAGLRTAHAEQFETDMSAFSTPGQSQPISSSRSGPCPTSQHSHEGAPARSALDLNLFGQSRGMVTEQLPSAHAPPQLGCFGRQLDGQERLEHPASFGYEREHSYRVSASPRGLQRPSSVGAPSVRLREPKATRGGWAAEVPTQAFGARTSRRFSDDAPDDTVKPLVRDVPELLQESGQRSASSDLRSVERTVHNTLVPSQDMPLLRSAENTPLRGGHFWTRSLSMREPGSRDRSPASQASTASSTLVLGAPWSAEAGPMSGVQHG